MTAVDAAPELNLEIILDTIYQIQVDLSLLTETLARDRNPNLNDRTLLDLIHLKFNLEGHTPSLLRN